MNLKRTLIIYNPKSGRFSKEKLSYIVSYFKNKNILTYALNMIERPIKKNLANFFDMVLVVGGDGSLNYVINNLVFMDIPIAHLPMGTVNLFAIENKTPYLLNKALDEIIYKYKPVKIKLGKVNEQYFIAMVGIGLDAFIVKNMEERIRSHKKRIYNNYIKYINYIFNIIKISGNYKFYDLSLNIINSDNTGDSNAYNFERWDKYHAKEIIVSNIKYYGGPFKIFPKNSPLNDKFDIKLIKNVNSRIDVIFSILKSLMFSKRYEDNPDFYIKASKISISSLDPSQNKNIFYQCDGEFAGTLPVEIEKVNNAITMLVNPSSFF